MYLSKVIIEIKDGPTSNERKITDKCVRRSSTDAKPLLFPIFILKFIFRDLETKDGLNVARDEFAILPLEFSNGLLTMLIRTSDCLVMRMLKCELPTIHAYRARSRRLA